MNDLDYLNQISAANAPAPKNILSHKKLFLILGGIVVFSILLIVVNSLLKNIGNKEGELLQQLSLRSSNLTATISSYNSSVKSSSLRSMGNTLSSILSETKSNVDTQLSSRFGAKDFGVTDNETAEISVLNSTLSNAKLNGILDRVYVRELTLQIAHVMSIESEIIARSGDQTTKDLISKSYDNLNTISTQFSNYSDRSN